MVTHIVCDQGGNNHEETTSCDHRRHRVVHAEHRAVRNRGRCTELNKTYKGGVAKTKTTKNKGGKTKYKPYANSSLYEANKSKDRDKDGIACER